MKDDLINRPENEKLSDPRVPSTASPVPGTHLFLAPCTPLKINYSWLQIILPDAIKQLASFSTLQISVKDSAWDSIF